MKKFFTIHHRQGWISSIDTYYSSDLVSFNVFSSNHSRKIRSITARRGSWRPGFDTGECLGDWREERSAESPYAFVRRITEQVIAEHLVEQYAGVTP